MCVNKLLDYLMKKNHQNHLRVLPTFKNIEKKTRATDESESTQRSVEVNNLRYHTHIALQASRQKMKPKPLR